MQHIQIDNTPTTWQPNAIYFVRNTGQIWQTDSNGVAVLMGKDEKHFFQWKKSNTVLASSSWTRVTFQIKDFDDDNLFDGSKFTVRKKGIYHVGGLATISSLSDGKKMIVAIRINNVLKYLLGRGVSGGTDLTGYSGSAMMLLEKDDEVGMFVYHNNTSDESLYYRVDGYNYFYANLIKEL